MSMRRAIAPSILLCVIAISSAAPIACSSEAADGVGQASAPDERVPIASVHGETIYRDEVEGALALRIYRLELDIHSLLVAEAERRIERRILEREAAARGIDVEALRAELEGQSAAVSDAEIDAYLVDHPPAPGIDPARARERVAHYLAERARLEGQIDALDALRQAADARILVDPPERPRTTFALEDAPTRGPSDAVVDVVHFASLTSRHASRSASKIERLASHFPDRLRRAHIHMLNDRDETALHAARIAVLLRTESVERFWAFHDALAAQGGKLDPSMVDEIARANGASDALIRDASRDSKSLALVKRDIDRAVSVGIPREPGVFVNGLFVSGLVPYEELEALVRDEVARIQ